MTEPAATIRAAVKVTIYFSLATTELTGTVVRTATAYSFEGTWTRSGTGPGRTERLRVIATGGRVYVASAALPGSSAARWVRVRSAKDIATITGSPTIDLAILDPRLYMHVVNPAYWASAEGIGEPEDKGGHRYSAGCSGATISGPPNCYWAKLGSLFDTWRGSLCDAAEDVWIDSGSHVIKRIAADWFLYSVEQVGAKLEATLTLTTQSTAAPISPPAVVS